jgi:hypothetical protein
MAAEINNWWSMSYHNAKTEVAIFYQQAGADSKDMFIYFLIPLYNMNKCYSLCGIG